MACDPHSRLVAPRDTGYDLPMWIGRCFLSGLRTLEACTGISWGPEQSAWPAPPLRPMFAGNLFRPVGGMCVIGNDYGVPSFGHQVKQASKRLSWFRLALGQVRNGKRKTS